MKHILFSALNAVPGSSVSWEHDTALGELISALGGVSGNAISHQYTRNATQHMVPQTHCHFQMYHCLKYITVFQFLFCAEDLGIYLI